MLSADGRLKWRHKSRFSPFPPPARRQISTIYLANFMNHSTTRRVIWGNPQRAPRPRKFFIVFRKMREKSRKKFTKAARASSVAIDKSYAIILITFLCDLRSLSRSGFACFPDSERRRKRKKVSRPTPWGEAESRLFAVVYRIFVSSLQSSEFQVKTDHQDHLNVPKAQIELSESSLRPFWKLM